MSTAVAPGLDDSDGTSVVAVVVTCNPGPWFEETLVALRDQQHPNLAVLVIDAASSEDPLNRIAVALPGAYVRRLNRNPGYAAAANRALRIVQGADYLLFVHDDAAPDPDAISLMIEQATRMNAGIVMPKLVSWDDDHRLLGLGGTVDLTGAFVPAIEADDLDQGQHDTPAEVLVPEGGCLLVRADLFTELGGFDPAITLYGEDVDLGLRAAAVGARCVTAPQARVRHLQASATGMRLLATPPVPLHLPSDDHPAQGLAPLQLDELPLGGAAPGESSARMQAGAQRARASDFNELVRPAVDEFVLRRRHRLRTVLKLQRRLGLVLTIFQLLLTSAAEIVWSLATGRADGRGRGQVASAIVAAWTWNLVHARDLGKLRRQAHRNRVVPARVLRYRYGSVRDRLERALRVEWERRRGFSIEGNRRELVGALRNLPSAVWATVVVLWVVGSRDLFVGDLPVVGQLVRSADSPVDSLARYLALRPGADFGTAVSASPAHLLSALAGAVVLGSDLVPKLLVLGAVPVGLWGMVRLARPLGSARATLLAVVAYVAVPLPYDALAFGRLDGLVAYALAPWVLGRLLGAHGALPYADQPGCLHVDLRRRRTTDDEDLATLVAGDLDGVDPDSAAARRLAAAAALLGPQESHGNHARRVTPGSGEPALSAAPITVPSEPRRDRIAHLAVRKVLPLALVLAVTGAFAPQAVPTMLAAAGLLALGARLSGERRVRSLRLLVIVVAAAAVALVLLAPGVLGSDAAGSGFFRATPSAARPDDLATLLGLHSGGFAAALATYGLIIAILPGLLVGQDWRFHLTARLCLVSLGLVLLSWAGVRGWLGPAVPDPHVTLAPAAAALALAAGVGWVAVTQDLQRYRFGWRQALPVVAVLGVIVAVLPVASRAGDGAWRLPVLSTARLLSWLPEQSVDGSFRVLWLGDGDVMPGGPRELALDLSGAVAVDTATPTGSAPPSEGGRGQRDIARAVEAARRGDTVQLGRRLGAYAVRWIAVPARTGAASGRGVDTPPPADLVPALQRQLDLRLIETDAAVTVFENTAWLPARSALPPASALAVRRDVVADDEATDLAARPPLAVLPNPDGSARSSWRGPVPAGDLYVAEASSSAWRLSVDGQMAPRREALGWANLFQVDRPGLAHLRWAPPAGLVAGQVFNLVLWVFTLVIAVRFRSRRGLFT